MRIRPAGCLEPASLALEIGKRECAVFEFGEPVSPNPERCGGMAGNFDFRLGVILIAHCGDKHVPDKKGWIHEIVVR